MIQKFSFNEWAFEMIAMLTLDWQANKISNDLFPLLVEKVMFCAFQEIPIEFVDSPHFQRSFEQRKKCAEEIKGNVVYCLKEEKSNE